MRTERIAKAPPAASLIAAVVVATSLSLPGCGSRTPEFVGSWTTTTGCGVTEFARVQFSADGSVRAALPTTLVDEAVARKRFGDAQAASMCARVLSTALPVDGTWREDGPRLDVDLATGTPMHLVLYHRVADGKLTLAKDAGFRDDAQTYEAAK